MASKQDKNHSASSRVGVVQTVNDEKVEKLTSDHDNPEQPDVAASGSYETLFSLVLEDDAEEEEPRQRRIRRRVRRTPPQLSKNKSMTYDVGQIYSCFVNGFELAFNDAMTWLGENPLQLEDGSMTDESSCSTGGASEYISKTVDVNRVIMEKVKDVIEIEVVDKLCSSITAGNFIEGYDQIVADSTNVSDEIIYESNIRDIYHSSEEYYESLDSSCESGNKPLRHVLIKIASDNGQVNDSSNFPVDGSTSNTESEITDGSQEKVTSANTETLPSEENPNSQKEDVFDTLPPEINSDATKSSVQERKLDEDHPIQKTSSELSALRRDVQHIVSGLFKRKSSRTDDDSKLSDETSVNMLNPIEKDHRYRARNRDNSDEASEQSKNNPKSIKSLISKGRSKLSGKSSTKKDKVEKSNDAPPSSDDEPKKVLKSNEVTPSSEDEPKKVRKHQTKNKTPRPAPPIAPTELQDTEEQENQQQKAALSAIKEKLESTSIGKDRRGRKLTRSKSGRTASKSKERKSSKSKERMPKWSTTATKSSAKAVAASASDNVDTPPKRKSSKSPGRAMKNLRSKVRSLSRDRSKGSKKKQKAAAAGKTSQVKEYIQKNVLNDRPAAPQRQRPTARPYTKQQQEELNCMKTAPNRTISPQRRQGTPSKRAGSPTKRDLTPSRKEVSPSRRGRNKSSPGQPTTNKREPSPIERELSSNEREPSPAKRAASPIRKRSSTPHRRTSSPTRKVTEPSKRSSSPPKQQQSGAHLTTSSNAPDVVAHTSHVTESRAPVKSNRHSAQVKRLPKCQVEYIDKNEIQEQQRMTMERQGLRRSFLSFSGRGKSKSKHHPRDRGQYDSALSSRYQSYGYGGR